MSIWANGRRISVKQSFYIGAEWTDLLSKKQCLGMLGSSGNQVSTVTTNGTSRLDTFNQLDVVCDANNQKFATESPC